MVIDVFLACLFICPIIKYFCLLLIHMHMSYEYIRKLANYVIFNVTAHKNKWSVRRAAYT